MAIIARFKPGTNYLYNNAEAKGKPWQVHMPYEELPRQKKFKTLKAARAWLRSQQPLEFGDEV